MEKFIGIFLVLAWMLVIPVEATVVSPKKGIAGAIQPEKVGELGVSWFYNWGYKPGYKCADATDNCNWTPEVWNKFVPLFYGTAFAGVEVNMTEICAKTNYCSRAGSYYLVGNEPDNDVQDWTGPTISGSTGAAKDEKMRFSARGAVVNYGDIIKTIKRYDPDANIILLGLTGDEPQGVVFLREFVRYWKEFWVNDPLIANLYTSVKGWHLHVYGHYSTRPDSDSVANGPGWTPRGFWGSLQNELLRNGFTQSLITGELWISEYGSLFQLPGEGESPRPAFLARMSRMTDIFESSPLVTRYAWFYNGCGTEVHQYGADNPEECNRWIRTSVYSYLGRTSTLTDLGRLYSNLPTNLSATPIPTIPVATSTPVPSNCTPCPLGVRAKSLGNANCDSKTSISDFMIWKKERIEYSANPQVRNNWKSDFNCDGRVLDNDLIIWRTNQQ